MAQTSVGAPGLWQPLTSPFLSSFSPRRNSLLRSVLRRISFSRDGVMSIGGVVLEGGYKRKQMSEQAYWLLIFFKKKKYMMNIQSV